MHKDEEKCPYNRLEKGWVVGSSDTSIEPHAVMIKRRNALITVFAMHGFLMDVGLAYPTILGFSSGRGGCLLIIDDLVIIVGSILTILILWIMGRWRAV